MGQCVLADLWNNALPILCCGNTASDSWACLHECVCIFKIEVIISSHFEQKLFWIFAWTVFRTEFFVWLSQIFIQTALICNIKSLKIILFLFQPFGVIKSIRSQTAMKSELLHKKFAFVLHNRRFYTSRE